MAQSETARPGAAAETTACSMCECGAPAQCRSGWDGRARCFSCHFHALDTAQPPACPNPDCDGDGGLRGTPGVGCAVCDAGRALSAEARTILALIAAPAPAGEGRADG